MPFPGKPEVLESSSRTLTTRRKRQGSLLPDNEDKKPLSKKPSRSPSVVGGEPEAVSLSEPMMSTSARESLSRPMDDSSVIDLTRNSDDKSEKATSPQSSTMKHDICFGAIDMIATMRHEYGKGFCQDAMTVELSKGDMLKLINSSSRQVGGILSSALRELLEGFQITLKAFVSGPKPRSNSKRQLNYFVEKEYDRTAARIVIYGVLSEERDLAYFLSDRRLFLQHPTASEYDARTTYFNPQYLPGPDGSMPAITDDPSSGQGNSPIAKDLNEVERAQLLKIFETASPLGADVERISQSPRIQSTLKDHQLSALAMMIERECGTLVNAKFPVIWKSQINADGEQRYHHIVTGAPSKEAEPKVVRGGVLADEMGLGKTLPALALVAWHIDNFQGLAQGSRNQSTLIIAPKSTIAEWELQIKRHTAPGSIHLLTYHGPKRQQLPQRCAGIDVVLTTYGTLRSEQKLKGPLFRETWARIILDEAHVIRNRSSQIFRVVCSLQATRRWCLTGTPIQNRLDDFGALLAFLQVPFVQEVERFNHYIVRPVNSQQTRALETLQKLIAATCLRRTKASVLGNIELPPKTLIDEKLKLDENTEVMHRFFARKAAELTNKAGNHRSNVLVVINVLRLVCNHGMDLLPDAAMKLWKARDNSVANWNLLTSEVAKCFVCGMEEESITGASVALKEVGCGHSICASCENVDNEVDHDSLAVESGTVCKACERHGGAYKAADGHVPGETAAYRPSVKVSKLLANLKQEVAPNSQSALNASKSVIFSYWAKMLDLIEIALKREGLHFGRLDGSKTLSERKSALEKFNDDPGCNVMLATIGSAGEGINLTVANSVHIMEPQWNPMVEAQAIDRAHRIGQTKEVRVTRYFMERSIENYVSWVQKQKLQLIERSLSDVKVENHTMTEERWKKLRESLLGADTV